MYRDFPDCQFTSSGCTCCDGYAKKCKYKNCYQILSSLREFLNPKILSSLFFANNIPISIIFQLFVIFMFAF